MKRFISYSPSDLLSGYQAKDNPDNNHSTGLPPEVRVALINVAGALTVELHRSNSNPTSDDLVGSFKDVYNSLVMLFLTPQI